MVKKSFLLSKILNDKKVCHFETEICFVRDFLLKRKQITDLTGHVLLISQLRFFAAYNNLLA